VRFGVEGHAQFRRRSIEVSESQLCDSQIVVGLAYLGAIAMAFRNSLMASSVSP
jgi:hypothetical protein